MNEFGPKLIARRLLDELGPPEAWQHASREAIDAHLRYDASAAAYWAAVQEELRFIAPRPGAGDFDIYRSAQTLVAERGMQEAWRHAMQQGAEAESDPPRQTYWLRVADAVNALAKGRGEEWA